MMGSDRLCLYEGNRACNSGYLEPSVCDYRIVNGQVSEVRGCGGENDRADITWIGTYWS